MKRLIVLLLSIFVLEVSAQKQLPDVNIKTIQGETVNIKEYCSKGKITVISFWATWCSPCKKELDAIADLYPEWKEKYGMELVAITIDDARTLPKVGPMVQGKGWEYTIFSDANEELKRSLNFQSIPMTFLVNSAGQIVYTHTGYTPGDENELEEQIMALNK